MEALHGPQQASLGSGLKCHALEEAVVLLSSMGSSAPRGMFAVLTGHLSATCQYPSPWTFSHVKSTLLFLSSKLKHAQNHSFPSSTEQEAWSLLILGARPGECCLRALAAPHSLGFSHSHHEHLELLDAHELPIFHLRPSGTPRNVLCHAALLTPAQPGIQNHTHGLPCLRATKGPSSHPVNSIPSAGPPLSPDSDSASLLPPWPRAETDTQGRCPTQARVHKGPTHLLLQIPGVLTVSQF